MFTLHVLQAQYGDCLLLEVGTSANAPHYVLIDGGPPNTYDRHLEPVLNEIAHKVTELDLVVLSHVDNDHIIGLVDFFSALKAQQDAGTNASMAVKELWHNSFSDTLDPDGTLEPRINSALQAAGAAALSTHAGASLLGVAEGRKLRIMATALGIPLNESFPNERITVETAPTARRIGSATFRVVGPSEANLAALKKEWEKWLAKHEDDLASDDPDVAAMVDRSVPNLSSIVLLVEADGKRLLLTGDARGDHVLDGLETAELLDADGRMHVDVLKLPHHGSDRNVNKAFFETLTADTYVVSADGRYDNPDLDTLTWIVDAARAAQRHIEIVCTNEAPAVTELRAIRAPETYDYRLRVLQPETHEIALRLA